MSNIDACISKALKKVNVQLSNNFKNGKNVVLFGTKHSLDSIDLVFFLLTLEELIFNDTSKRIVFLSTKSFASKNSQFKNTDELKKYILNFFDSLESV